MSLCPDRPLVGFRFLFLFARSMFPFAATPKAPEVPETTPVSARAVEAHPLDELTGGAFSAPTSGERTARIRAWLAGAPGVEQMQMVFKELSVKDKGASKLLRERLDEIKRSRGQASLANEWAEKAAVLLALPKLNIADAMAWQRDAAKAGAPLSKEPLAALRGQLSERVRCIEDLQHRVQVQREAAVLLAQRIEVLSTKSWRDAQGVVDSLRSDVEHWQAQARQLSDDANWPSVDSKFPPLLEASRAQLLVVWQAFSDALAQASAAADDAAAALPAVPVWADELRAARGLAGEAAAKPKRPVVDPELRARANSSVREVLSVLEKEVAQGHGKASTGAASALRNALKEYGRLIDTQLDAQAHAALAAAGELEGWQRWRADQLREELVTKAEGLLARPQGQAIGGRKMQENLRALREQWKQTDQGGVPNHGLWKRFDDACNEAHKVVDAWLEKIRAEAAEHRAQRLALIGEVNAWAAANPVALDDDWKGFNRILHQFGERWRDGGHVGEKAFAELQPLWMAAIEAAAAPLEAMREQSLIKRQAMIEEARLLGEAAQLRIDAVKALQQRWQAESHFVPMERRQEQKLWDAFRKPLDEAFNRKSQQRQQAEAALGERDRVVLEAARALEQANSSGDAQGIRSAMHALEAALRGQAQAQAAVLAAGEPNSGDDSSPEPAAKANNAPEVVAQQAPDEAGAGSNTPPPAPAKPAARPVVAVRGDDRPGMQRSEPVPADRARRDGKRDKSRGAREEVFTPGRPALARRDGRLSPRAELPRLSEPAFRAQRDALEHAQSTLRKLAAQAHGEALTVLLEAWEKRDAAQLPSAQAFGAQVPAATRNAWLKALGQRPGADAGSALLRLEMAAELPTPAEYLQARRALQLQLLTRRNDPSPAQTWAQDVSQVLSSEFDPVAARRLQNVLKVLFRSPA